MPNCFHVGARHPAILQQQLARAARANAELVLFLADGEPGKAALDEEGGDPPVTGFRVDAGKDDEQVGFVRVGDPELPAGQDEMVTRFHGAGRQREGVAARPGFRERVRADSIRRQARQVSFLQVVRAPAQQRVDDQGVLHIDEDADGGVDRGQSLDRED